MTIERRLQAAEAQLGPAGWEDEWWGIWVAFRDAAYATLEAGGHDEALAVARDRVAGNERHVFPGKGAIVRDGWDVRVWVLSETVWFALQDYPEAKAALEQALDAAQAELASMTAPEAN